MLFVPCSMPIQKETRQVFASCSVLFITGQKQLVYWYFTVAKYFKQDYVTFEKTYLT